MTSNERHAKPHDESAKLKARDAGQAKADPRAQELTEKELGAVTGGFGVTNTGTGGSNLGSGAGRGHQ